MAQTADTKATKSVWALPYQMNDVPEISAYADPTEPCMPLLMQKNGRNALQ
jgi:hypothetical protein